MQILVSINNPPQAGSVEPSPLEGVGLSTSFDVEAIGWEDPESDLPLSYSYAADGVVLAHKTETLHITVRGLLTAAIL